MGSALPLHHRVEHVSKKSRPVAEPAWTQRRDSGLTGSGRHRSLEAREVSTSPSSVQGARDRVGARSSGAEVIEQQHGAALDDGPGDVDATAHGEFGNLVVGEDGLRDFPEVGTTFDG
jgi:hypothetical protein